MIEAIVAMCLVTKFNGDPVNPCYIERHEQIFRSYSACRTWGDERAIELKGASNDDYSVVSTVACVEYKGSS